MSRTTRPRGKRTPNLTITCEWCGDPKETTREDTKTCGPRCRQRLCAFTMSCGYPPDAPPGKITAKDAIDLELFRLLTNERRRREAATAERRAFLARKCQRV